MYKMVAIDLDDTLLDNDNQISRQNKEVIERLLDKGMIVTIISGRSYASIKRYVDLLRLKHLCGSLNGASIILPENDEIVYRRAIHHDICRELIIEIEPLGVHINYYHDSKVLSSKQTKQAEAYMQLTNIEIDYVSSLKEYSREYAATKILLIDDNEKLEPIRQKISPKFIENVNISYSKPIFLEIFNKDVSKGKALQYIAEYYGIQREEIIAIGDGETDISMIEYAGIGIAMGNSSQRVKEKANYIAETNQQNGVAKILEKLILNR
ncbi:hypothetical protein SAMN02745975_01933 [Geosporobacter subterraneus DSM 17957]|uniref:Cof subfamily of IIB subfamily of haloacid dehalogenase superfamily/HAD-superfamily hydrolase, subfamily IIB n=1 Tax=Geosporobacter subterraneus DSM 17957 TaxID=1121919 RepID=A0A1M6IR26_9FIRM|nr:Cof-type HAD-IIB family hydrolase [Geosporobacter subterraneus]SHJ36857.1 hypothetical protein SAMN02745975_01933 [Geosporobacter subterraneus DSM 17957]